MNIIVFGANSDIVKSLLYQFSGNNNFFLFSKSKTKEIDTLIQKKKLSNFFFYKFDVLKNELNQNTLSKISLKYGSLDLAIIGYGIMPENNYHENQHVKNLFQINVISKINLINLIISNFKMNNYGRLIILGSVAGDRGRAKNYYYGSSKSALNTYVEGKIYDLKNSHINVHLIKLGMVRTKLTSKHPKSILMADKNNVARCILKEVFKNKKVIYIPRFWYFVMFIIKNLPLFIMKKIRF
jgi:short-subunit dehydrogenase